MHPFLRAAPLTGQITSLAQRHVETQTTICTQNTN